MKLGDIALGTIVKLPDGSKNYTVVAKDNGSGDVLLGSDKYGGFTNGANKVIGIPYTGWVGCNREIEIVRLPSSGYQTMKLGDVPVGSTVIYDGIAAEVLANVANKNGNVLVGTNDKGDDAHLHKRELVSGYPSQAYQYDYAGWKSNSRDVEARGPYGQYNPPDVAPKIKEAGAPSIGGTCSAGGDLILTPGTEKTQAKESKLADAPIGSVVEFKDDARGTIRGTVIGTSTGRSICIGRNDVGLNENYGWPTERHIDYYKGRPDFTIADNAREFKHAKWYIDNTKCTVVKLGEATSTKPSVRKMKLKDIPVGSVIMSSGIPITVNRKSEDGFTGSYVKSNGLRELINTSGPSIINTEYEVVSFPRMKLKDIPLGSTIRVGFVGGEKDTILTGKGKEHLDFEYEVVKLASEPDKKIEQAKPRMMRITNILINSIIKHNGEDVILKRVENQGEGSVKWNGIGAKRKFDVSVYSVRTEDEYEVVSLPQPRAFKSIECIDDRSVEGDSDRWIGTYKITDTSGAEWGISALGKSSGGKRCNGGSAGAALINWCEQQGLDVGENFDRYAQYVNETYGYKTAINSGAYPKDWFITHHKEFNLRFAQYEDAIVKNLNKASTKEFKSIKYVRYLGYDAVKNEYNYEWEITDTEGKTESGVASAGSSAGAGGSTGRGAGASAFAGVGVINWCEKHNLNVGKNFVLYVKHITDNYSKQGYTLEWMLKHHAQYNPKFKQYEQEILAHLNVSSEKRSDEFYPKTEPTMTDQKMLQDVPLGTEVELSTYDIADGKATVIGKGTNSNAGYTMLGWKEKPTHAGAAPASSETWRVVHADVVPNAQEFKYYTWRYGNTQCKEIKKPTTKEAIANETLSAKSVAEYYKQLGEIMQTMVDEVSALHKREDEANELAYDMVRANLITSNAMKAQIAEIIRWTPEEIKHERELVNDILIKNAIEKRNQRTKQGTKETAMSNDSIEKTVMQKFLEDAKSEAKEGMYFATANQMTKAVKAGILKMMKDKHGMDDGKLAAIASVLDTEIGSAFISWALGQGLPHIPGGIGEDARVQQLAKKFRVSGYATATGFAFDTVKEYIMPAITGAMATLPPIGDLTSSVKDKLTGGTKTKARVVEHSEEHEETEEEETVSEKKQANA
jgi:hypothetical protein